METLSLVTVARDENNKGKPTLPELAELIRYSYQTSRNLADQTQDAAVPAIAAALECGGFLREAKRSLAHGEFLSWLRRETGIHRRTATNYMRLHVWSVTHPKAMLTPHGLRQLYILAGILPEDDDKVCREAKDDLARLRRFVRRTCLEAAAHRGYQQRAALRRALLPMELLLDDLQAEDANGKHVSHLETDCTEK